ncbi:MAG: flippase [Erysipelotrichaceae bacterium]|nr:flippase [Erysipelotrichaceae bacterium]
MFKFFKNISYSLLGKVIAMVFWALLDIVAARLLGKDAYAEWAYFFAIATMLFYIGWFGINASAKVYISKYENEPEKKQDCLLSSIIIRFAVSLIIGLAIYFILPGYAESLGFPDKYPNLKWLFECAAVLVIMNSITEFLKSLFMGLNRFKELFIVTVLEHGGYFVFSVILLMFGRNVRSIAYGYLLGGLITNIIGFIYVFINNRIKYPVKFSNFKPYLKEIGRYALPMAFIGIGGMVLVEMDTFMLGLFSTKSDVAVYNIAKSLCSKATHVNFALAVGVMTSFSLVDRDNVKEKKKEFIRMELLNIFIALSVSLCFLIFAGIAIKILYGDEYVEAASLLRMLVLYYSLYSISNFYSVFLDFRKKANIRSFWYASIIVINFTLNYLWIPVYGATGACWATGLSLVPYTIATFIETRKEWKKLSLQ